MREGGGNSLCYYQAQNSLIRIRNVVRNPKAEVAPWGEPTSTKPMGIVQQDGRHDRLMQTPPPLSDQN